MPTRPPRSSPARSRAAAAGCGRTRSRRCSPPTASRWSSSGGVGSVAAAAKAAAELGGPVALKGVAPGVVHKAQAGAVRLGLSGPTAVQRAAQEVAANARDRGHARSRTSSSSGWLTRGVEMLVGVLADERFGPVVACGAGGGTAEVLGDVAVRLAPLAREDALEMIGQLRSLRPARTRGRGRRRARRHRRPRRRARRRPSGDRRARPQPRHGRPRRRAGGRRARARRAARRPARVPGGGAMKRIGLLGGMSWESTIEYYRLVNELVAEQLGGLHSADCILRSRRLRRDRGAPARGPVGRRGHAAGAGGAGARGAPARSCSCCARTRCTSSRPRSSCAITIPFVHIADTTADAVRGGGPGARRPARHRLHDGAGLLRRAAALRARPRRLRARTPPTARSSTT